MTVVRLSVCALLMLALCRCAETRTPEPTSPDAANASASPGPSHEAGPITAPDDAAIDPWVDAGLPTDADVAAEAGVRADAGGSAGGDAGPDGPGRARALVDPARWGMTTAADDPFADRPADVACATSAAMAEELGAEPAFSVDTGSCNYLCVVQPSRSRVEAGETLKVRLWHFDLTAPEPAEAHAVVMVDGIVVLDQRVSIPGQGGLLVNRVSAPRAVEAGAPVYFHLHNHGANSWSLVEVSAGP